MDLKMEVYTPGLERIGLLEKYKSVVWEDKAFTAGSFSIDAYLDESTRPLLAEENIIWFEGETAGIIEHCEKDAKSNGTYITVKGRLLAGILERRILWHLYNLSGPAPAIMEYLVEDCCINPTRGDVEARKIPGLMISFATAGGTVIQKQVTGGYLLDVLEEIGRAYKVAFGVRFNPAVPRMEFWTRPCADRSIHQSQNEQVFYSTELDDVLSSAYSYNSIGWRNVALVAGEGEGMDRKLVVVEEDVSQETDTPVTPPAPTLNVTITLSVDPAGGGVASGGGRVEIGTKVIVTASPASGYTFVEWQEDGQSVSTSRTYTFTAAADRSLAAKFATSVPTYTISASVDPPGSGSVTGAGSYKERATATLRATATDGYNFSEWKEDGFAVHNTVEYSFAVNKSRNLIAAFSEVKLRLPDGYVELQYVQINSASENVYIDTGCKLYTARNTVWNLKAVIDVEITEFANADRKFAGIWYTYRSAASQTCYEYVYLGANNSGISACENIGIGSAPAATILSADKTPRRMTLTLDTKNQIAAIDGEQKTVERSTLIADESGRDFRLFGWHGSSTARIPAKWYSAKIYSDDVLVRDYVPCKSADGSIGLFDLVSNQFFPNQGTGELAAGPAV